MGNTPKDPLDHEPAAVEQARRQAGLSKSEVARRAGVSLSLISMVEKGSRNAGPALIDAMAGIFGCPADQLKRRNGSPGTRLAMVCVECSELWEPDHECPSRRAA
jgi:transcriptional regulator with XRE-family HTH domain